MARMGYGHRRYGKIKAPDALPHGTARGIGKGWQKVDGLMFVSMNQCINRPHKRILDPHERKRHSKAS